MTTIRYAHAGDLDTNAAHALAWNVGEVSERYQEIAIVGDRVVGAWTYSIEWRRGRAKISSGRTDVTTRYRRKGVARALWLRAIARWNPTYIEARISTDDGLRFLARMTAEIAYRSTDTALFVNTREQDTCWSEFCEYEARELLRKVGERARAVKSVEVQQLKLVKGAGS